MQVTSGTIILDIRHCETSFTKLYQWFKLNDSSLQLCIKDDLLEYNSATGTPSADQETQNSDRSAVGQLESHIRIHCIFLQSVKLVACF